MENEQLKSIARNLELENKYISVENAYLQNQISPHLLFNSLAFIYNSIYKFSETAGNGVMRLSELMRYSLVSADDKRTVSLSDEIKQMENLIGLCRLQYNGHFTCVSSEKEKSSGLILSR
jgi:two-component system LytT family sensor kinase